MSTFLCGVIEGFYGPPWTHKQRLHLIRFMKSRKLNAYVYAPKNDEKHLKNWRDVYDSSELERMAKLIKVADDNDILFVFALSPGKDICYSREQDYECLWIKYTQMMSIGCHSFGLFFDDLTSDLMHEADKTIFSSLSDAQAALCNKVHAAFEGNVRKFIICPTIYCDDFANGPIESCQYLNNLGSLLKPGIEFFWTGPSVISTTITLESIEPVAKAMRRKPIIWDNLFANDYDCDFRFFLGPYSHRTPDLKQTQGVLLNPNCQFGANYIPISSFGAWVTLASYQTDAVLTVGANEWVEEFKECYAGKTVLMKVTTEDVKLLIDLFYLPFVWRDAAAELVEAVKCMLGLSAEADESIEQEKRKYFEEKMLAIDRIVTALSLSAEHKKSNLHELYPTVKKLQLILHNLDKCKKGARIALSPPRTKNALSIIKQLRALLPSERLPLVDLKLALQSVSTQVEKVKR